MSFLRGTLGSCWKLFSLIRHWTANGFWFFFFFFSKRNEGRGGAFAEVFVVRMSAIRKLIPLADRVLVKRMEPALKTAGGIFLPESATKKEVDAEVVAVGPGGRTANGELIPMTVAVGDKVLLPEYGGHTVKLGEEEFQLFRNDDILGKFEN